MDNNYEKFEIMPIGYVRSCYSEKFGIPRQAGLVKSARATIILFPPFNRSEMVKDLSHFSHIWVFFLFHNVLEEGWKATVRPPGLGGKKRVGVYASRSPHRPNHLGLSAVSLLNILDGGDGVCLEVGGGDFLNDTPVVDIKPYLPYCDALKNVDGGFGGLGKTVEKVSFSEECELFCTNYYRETGRDLRVLVEEILTSDPRPPFQRDRKKEFGMMLWDVNIRWIVKEDCFEVIQCRRKTKN